MRRPRSGFRDMLRSMKGSIAQDQTIAIDGLPEVVVLPLDADVEAHLPRRGLLSEGERRLLAGLSGERRRISFTAGRLAAKIRILGLLAPDGESSDTVSIPELDLARTATGALALSIRGIARPDIRVSISHGGKFAVADAVQHRLVGIDVEPVSRKCAALKDAFAVASENEILAQTHGDSDHGALAYTRLFSAKEAAAKCLSTHMYFAFHHYRLVDAASDRLVLADLSATNRLLQIESVDREAHVFSRLLIDELA